MSVVPRLRMPVLGVYENILILTACINFLFVAINCSKHSGLTQHKLILEFCRLDVQYILSQ